MMVCLIQALACEYCHNLFIISLIYFLGKREFGNDYGKIKNRLTQ